MRDSSPYRWLEERGPAGHLIALIDEATSRVYGRLVEHDSTEENLRTLRVWLEGYGRPLALYTDKSGLVVTSRQVQWQEQLRGEPARTQIGCALQELDIEWIAALSPQAKGRIERLFGTLPDRLVKEMRWRKIDTLEAAHRFLELTFWPWWETRFARRPIRPRDAHRRLEAAHRFLELTFWPWWETRFARRPIRPRDAHRRLEAAHRLRCVSETVSRGERNPVEATGHRRRLVDEMEQAGPDVHLRLLAKRGHGRAAVGVARHPTAGPGWVR